MIPAVGEKGTRRQMVSDGRGEGSVELRTTRQGGDLCTFSCGKKETHQRRRNKMCKRVARCRPYEEGHRRSKPNRIDCVSEVTQVSFYFPVEKTEEYIRQFSERSLYGS